jgi:hypothetical protein
MMIVFGSMAMTVVQNKNLGGVGNIVSGMLGTANKFSPPTAPSNIPQQAPPTATYGMPQYNENSPKINLKPPTIPAPSWATSSSTASMPAPVVTPVMPKVVPDKVFENTRKIDISTPTSVRRSKKQQIVEEAIEL